MSYNKLSEDQLAAKLEMKEQIKKEEEIKLKEIAAQNENLKSQISELLNGKGDFILLYRMNTVDDDIVINGSVKNIFALASLANQLVIREVEKLKTD